MGRRKSRAKEDTQISRSGLEPAFPSSPHRLPRYSLNCKNVETNRVYIVNTFALYAAKKIVEEIMGDNEAESTTGESISFGDFDIESPELLQILRHKYTPEEAAWELPSPYPQDIERFLNGQRITSELITVQRDANGALPHRSVQKPKIDRSGKITVQDICAELKLEPRDARAMLRKAKIEKPAGGWLGDAKWADGIRAVLAKGKK